MEIYLLNNKNDLSFVKFMKYALLSLIMMHLTGLIYLTIQLLIFNKQNLIFYNIGLYTLSKFPFQIVTLIPIFLAISLINKLKD